VKGIRDSSKEFKKEEAGSLKNWGSTSARKEWRWEKNPDTGEFAKREIFSRRLLSGLKTRKHQVQVRFHFPKNEKEEKGRETNFSKI